VLAELTELVDELATVHTTIAARALEHIHSKCVGAKRPVWRPCRTLSRAGGRRRSETILTLGNSRTVEQFLRTARSRRAFQVMVVERAPWYDGQQLAARLAAAGIDTTLIPDSAVFAMMARVNKVIVGTHAGAWHAHAHPPSWALTAAATVLANGGLLAPSGSCMVAMAAKHHATPVVVLAGTACGPRALPPWATRRCRA
jgi:translation initiation factor eIF-2B subunit beta